ncbi:response regulator [Paenibacillus cineris]|uniref:Response regulatory domain-containing protein n=1 Tax=Paenibacillus cineris TaxID=237530 RepID=A0ABQ4LN44_9BACL|nr:response regulator [Paenibacillus cineris]GIO57936.1 hypothetical protein J21TS7_62540 [Paenibacillus cineris]
MKVLVVEDQEIDRIVMVRILQKLGYSADTATNGMEALAALKFKSYHLIFMDIHMPIMDGVIAFQQIYYTIPSPPPIIAVTGDLDKRKLCLALGMIDFIEKPVAVQRIKQSIKSVITNKDDSY